MKTMSPLLLVAALSLGACADLASQMEPAAPASTVPEEVRAIAAPFQDLNTAVVLEEDNCYWYQHRGPVETTMLPLRTTRGNTICVAAETPAPVTPADTPAPVAPGA